MKKLLIAMLVVVLVLVLVGCGADKPEVTPNETETEVTPSQSETEVTPAESEEITEPEAGTEEPTEPETTESETAEPETTTENTLTQEMAYEGVNNYCHSEYDWSVAEENPEMMYVAMGEETETEYQVMFRSYTGAIIHFYVDKATGTTRIVETVPTQGIENELGTINLYDYLNEHE